MLKAALIGFGGIAKSHRRALANLEKEGIVSLICACDVNPDAYTARIKINNDGDDVQIKEHINFYTDAEEMYSKESFDLVIVCTPSFLHSRISCDALSRGYHVLCEKPMALNYEDCLKMINAAEAAGRELMIGQCLRFYPAFDYVKAAIDDNRFGKVIGGFFSRLSTPPNWGWENWFMNPERSGGCITDLHIHDVDLVRYLFGDPKAVSCRSHTSICAHDVVHSTFEYYDGAPITAVGDWTLKGVPFKASTRIDFEKATVIFEDGVLTIYPKDDNEPYEVELAKHSGHEGELRYFCGVINGEIKNEKNPATSAAKTIRLIEQMKESAESGGVTLEVV